MADPFEAGKSAAHRGEELAVALEQIKDDRERMLVELGWYAGQDQPTAAEVRS